MTMARNVVVPRCDRHDRASLYDEQVRIIRAAGRYIERHATDFVGCYGSDEVTVADGLDITIRITDELPTITVRREMLVLNDAGGVA